jgi:hypothetical protein
MKKYKTITKVSADKFVTYNVNDLIKFTKFLDEKYTGWRWFNVHIYEKEGKGAQIGNFTNKNRPTSRFI